MIHVVGGIQNEDVALCLRVSATVEAIDTGWGMEPDPLIARRRALVTAIYALQCAWGVRSAFNPGGYETILASIAAGVFATQFCMVDSKIIGRPLAWSLQWLLFFTWMFSVPVYLVWARGWRQLHWVAVYIVAYVVAGWLPCLLMSDIVSRM